MRIKPIPPTLRDKRRYLLVRNADWRTIESAVRRRLGTIYRSLSGLKKIEEGQNYTIIRVDRGFEQQVRAVLALECGEQDPIFVERVSGTVKTIRDIMNSTINE